MCKRRKEKRAQREEDNKYKTARVEKREHPIMQEREDKVQKENATGEREKKQTPSFPLTRIPMTYFPSIEPSICDFALPIRATLEPSVGCYIHELKSSLLSYLLTKIFNSTYIKYNKVHTDLSQF